jgi:hypothetical protein
MPMPGGSRSEIDMKIIQVLSILIIFFNGACLAQSDQPQSLTFTTYYPSPNGVFNRLQTKRLAIGDRNNDGKLSDADQPPNDYQLYIGRSVIYQPLNSLPASGTPGELAYNASADAFNYYNASGSWVPLGGGGGSRCYDSYNGTCLAGFTKKSSLGVWGGCHYNPAYLLAGGTNYAGSGCPPKSLAPWPYNDPDYPAYYSIPWLFIQQGEAFLCCQ